MDALPPEVLQIICSYLSFNDAANVRFLSRDLSIIAANFLLKRVRFHTSEASLARLENISNHPIFSRNVKTLVYEAALLADVHCRQEYTSHFELDHHGLERPREPPANCSDRERRLYLRNKRKWSANIFAKYDTYRSLYETQRSLLEQRVLAEVLSRCIPRFYKLEHIDVDPIRRCSHMTSRRFIEEFGTDCASPLSGNFSRISNQLESLLLPNSQIITSLRRLKVNSLSPSLFRSSLQGLLQQAFSRLTQIEIGLKLADNDLHKGEQARECFERHLSNGVLRTVLSSARSVTSLTLAIETPLPFFVGISNVLSDTVWHSLELLDLTSFTSTQDEFMAMLVRQPQLESLNLTMVQLTQGKWPDTLDEMRTKLELLSFMPLGFLEDSEECWPMDLIYIPMYIDDYEEFDLSSAIDIYVTEQDDDFHDEGPPNPLGAGFDQFEEAEIVRDTYGAPSSFAGMDSSDDSEMHEAISDTDVSMSDLTNTE